MTIWIHIAVLALMAYTVWTIINGVVGYEKN